MFSRGTTRLISAPVATRTRLFHRQYIEFLSLVRPLKIRVSRVVLDMHFFTMLIIHIIININVTQMLPLCFSVPIIPDYLIVLEDSDLVPPQKPADTTASSDIYWNHSIYNSSHYEHWLYNVSLFNWTDMTSQQLINENGRVGWLFSSKAIVQLVATPFVGSITNRYVGYMYTAIQSQKAASVAYLLYK